MIQFKFSKTAGYDTIQFAGIGMKLSELKAAIIAKKNLAPDSSQAHAQTVDLYIHNAETGVGMCVCLSFYYFVCLPYVAALLLCRVHEPGRNSASQFMRDCKTEGSICDFCERAAGCPLEDAARRQAVIDVRVREVLQAWRPSR